MKVLANTRETQGTSASRRLRTSGKVPGIVYGGAEQPINIELDHNDLYHALRKEAFHSSILDLEIEGRGAQQVLLRDVQMHAFKQQVLHIDFQRVAADRKINVKVPLHFINAESSPAVKLSAAIVSHVATELEVSCLPASLPEFITVDLSELTVNQSIHLSDISLPEGVTAVSQENPAIATAMIPRGAMEEVAAAAAPGAVAAPEKKEEKKEDQKK
jgi:large subunit ribosomal protein L25